MRLTVNLDEDVYRMAKALAVSEHCSISLAVNKLVRRLMESPTAISKSPHERFPISKCRTDKIISSEDVARLDLEDDKP